ncbi:MAG TPA: hypothetical protein VFV28_03510 [Limnobacter sp.]|nr:hypothetical protein [Limnobacter sp.]
MKTIQHLLACGMLAASVLPAIAQDASQSGSSQPPAARQGLEGTTDAETGLSTRTWLKEQAEGINRGEVEAYRAESAGKAYRAYSDSIGKPSQQAPTSQVSTIRSN